MFIVKAMVILANRHFTLFPTSPRFATNFTKINIQNLLVDEAFTIRCSFKSSRLFGQNQKVSGQKWSGIPLWSDLEGRPYSAFKHNHTQFCRVKPIWKSSPNCQTQMVELQVRCANSCLPSAKSQLTKERRPTNLKQLLCVYLID